MGFPQSTFDCATCPVELILGTPAPGDTKAPVHALDPMTPRTAANPSSADPLTNPTYPFAPRDCRVISE